MQTLTTSDYDFLSEKANWLEGPDFHILFYMPFPNDAKKLEDIFLLDKIVHPWQIEAMSSLSVANYCILNRPEDWPIAMGAKYFTMHYKEYSLFFVSIPPHHLARLCGKRWVYDEFVPGSMEQFHQALLDLISRLQTHNLFTTVILKDEAWPWPKMENLDKGIILKSEFAHNAGWHVKKNLMSGFYAVLSDL